jgi:hypothetical protein
MVYFKSKNGEEFFTEDERFLIASCLMHEIRALKINDEPLFFVQDIAEILGTYPQAFGNNGATVVHDKYDAVRVSNNVHQHYRVNLVSVDDILKFADSKFAHQNQKAIKKYFTEIFPYLMQRPVHEEIIEPAAEAVPKVNVPMINTDFDPDVFLYQMRNMVDVVMSNKIEIENMRKRTESLLRASESLMSAVTAHINNDWRESIRIMMSEIIHINQDTGGDGVVDLSGNSWEQLYKHLYNKFEIENNIKLEPRLKQMRNRMRKAGATKAAIDDATYINVIEADRALREKFYDLVHRTFKYYKNHLEQQQQANG